VLLIRCALSAEATRRPRRCARLPRCRGLRVCGKPARPGSILCVLWELGTRRLLGLPCECCDSREQDASVIAMDTGVCARCGAVRRELAQCCCHRFCRGTPRVAAGFGGHFAERGTLLSPRLGVNCALEMGGGVCVEHYGAKSACVDSLGGAPCG
jgi:hypothetical protein